MLATFPTAEGDDFSFLVESIRERGIYLPVLVDHEGRTLLHGRARVLAHIAAGRDPTVIPRKMLPPNVRHEAVLDMVLSGVLASRRLPGVAFMARLSTVGPFYDAAAVRRARFGAARPHLSAVTKRTPICMSA